MRDWNAETIALVLGAITAVIGALATAAVKVISALQGVSGKIDQTQNQVAALEIKVDGRLTQLLERTATSSRAEGVVAGRGEMAMIPTPPVTSPVDAGPVQADGTMVIGVPNNPTPPVLLVPVEGEKPKE